MKKNFLFLTNFYFSPFRDLDLIISRNNSLKVKLNLIKNKNELLGFNFPIILNKSTDNFLFNLGSWFFNNSFIFHLEQNKFFYITKFQKDIRKHLVSKRVLFFSFFRCLGNSFKLSCSIFGVGYRVKSLKKNLIRLKIGRSYLVNCGLPLGLKALVFGKRKNKIKFFSQNLTKLMIFIFLFRNIRWPDSYKGKGIKFNKQKIKIKFREKFGSIHYKNKK